MSKFMKTIRIIFSFLIIILSIFTYITIEGDSKIGLDMKALQDKFLEFSMEEYGFYIISVVTVIIIIGALILLISTLVRKTKTLSLTLVDDGGRVVLADDAIESYAERSLKSFPELKDIRLNCKILNGKSKKIVIKVRAGVYNAMDLSSFSVQIKDRLKSDMDKFIGKDISEVDIIIDNISGNNISVNDTINETKNEIDNEINKETNNETVNETNNDIKNEKVNETNNESDSMKIE